jgi:hypothetical protein
LMSKVSSLLLKFVLAKNERVVTWHQRVRGSDL